MIAVSWRSLFNLQNHGFYRFLSWECILWLFASNYRDWFSNPFGIQQVISWILLVLSAYAVVAGVFELKKAGKAARSRKDKELYAFEKTTELVDSGIYKYIRHPLYASLLYLTWGVFLKNITPETFVVSLLSSGFLFVTARYDEKECQSYFGDQYREYMTRSKRFIPFVF